MRCTEDKVRTYICLGGACSMGCFGGCSKFGGKGVFCMKRARDDEKGFKIEFNVKFGL